MAITPKPRIGRFDTFDGLDPLPRYFRIQHTPNTVGVEAALKETENLPAFEFPNTIGVNLHTRGPIFAPVKKCIYCGATELRRGSGLPLSEEHIIAEGLGGNLILPEASCEDCAKRTSAIEGAILRTSLFATRARLQIRGKKRKRQHRDSYPVTTVVGGKDVEIMIPLAEHPTTLFMVGFQPPRFLTRSPRRSDLACFWIHHFGPFDEAYKSGADSIATPSFDTVRFCQFIAKIAHGYAVATLGLDGFKPLLREFILRRFVRAEQCSECFHYVGGAVGFFAPSADLHTISHVVGKIPGSPTGRGYVVVAVRLFANLGAPVYTAVVGEVAPKR